jgi:hypothetical protein
VDLQDGTVGVRIDRATGALLALGPYDGSWPLQGRAELALSFRLLVPLPGRRYNHVDGLAQHHPELQADPDGRTVTLSWDSVSSQHGGRHRIAVRMVIGVRDGAVTFQTTIANHSELTVETVEQPMVGDLRTTPGCTDLHVVGPFYGGANRTMLRPRFDTATGFCSYTGPTFANTKANAIGGATVPVVPFVLLESGDRGACWTVDEPSGELLTWHGELLPGWADSMGGWVPPADTIDGRPAHIRFGAVHVPFIGPGETRTLTRIAIQPYTGDWHVGAEIYRARREGWMRDAEPPRWITEPHSWQQIQLNSAEDSLHTPFSELPRIAAECAQRGVSAIQVVGWNDGGQDRGNPSHDPDPRLGGADELRRAIAECHGLGVKVALFGKFVWSDRSSERFRTELQRLAVRDPYGDYYVFPGFRYDTITQLLDINTRRFVPMCFSAPDWMEVCRNEFATIVDLGADGMVNDEAMHHTPALLCFDTSHGHRRGAPVYARDRKLLDTFRSATPAPSPDFLFASEGPYDWLFSAYPMSYQRSNTADHLPLARYLHPRAAIMTAITGYDDRNMLNQCLLYRYIASYEPQFFKGRLPDFDLTVSYGRRMDALRSQLREWLWDGEFRDTVGATVRDGSGDPHRPYSVFRSAGDGSPAVCLANYHRERTVQLTVDIAGAAGPYSYRLVDRDTWRDASDGVVLPPRSAAVIVPAGAAVPGLTADTEESES